MQCIIILKYYFIASNRDESLAKISKNLSDNRTKTDKVYKS